MFLTTILDFAEKMMFARLDFSTFLICFSRDLSGNKSEEKASVAICGGLSHNLAYIDWPIIDEVGQLKDTYRGPQGVSRMKA